MTRETPTCETCQFWRRPPDMGSFGRCQRHPPVILDPSKLGLLNCAQPVSAEYDWCGEHRPLAATPAPDETYRDAAVTWAEAQALLFVTPGHAMKTHEAARAIHDREHARETFLRLYRERHGG